MNGYNCDFFIVFSLSSLHVPKYRYLLVPTGGRISIWTFGPIWWRFAMFPWGGGVQKRMLQELGHLVWRNGPLQAQYKVKYVVCCFWTSPMLCFELFFFNIPRARPWGAANARNVPEFSAQGLTFFLRVCRCCISVVLNWWPWCGTKVARPRGWPRSHWGNYSSRLVWENLGVSQEELDSVADEKEAWNTLLSFYSDLEWVGEKGLGAIDSYNG